MALTRWIDSMTSTVVFVAEECIRILTHWRHLDRRAEERLQKSIP